MAITRKEKKDIIKTSPLSRYYEKKIFYEKRSILNGAYYRSVLYVKLMNIRNSFNF